jgi:hypothetical protein
MSREDRARARALMQKRIAKRKGCVPRLKGDCGRSSCASRPRFVKSYTVTTGKYAVSNRGQYCRRPRNSGSA